MLLIKAISPIRAIVLVIAQMAGGMLASVIVRFLFPETFNVRTTLGGGTNVAQGVFIEAILTAELVFTVLMLAWEKHRATVRSSTHMRIRHAVWQQKRLT